MKVNFIIPGAQKCATSTLHNLLNQHPQLQGCSVKEPHFFSTTRNWKQEVEKYEELFPRKKDVLYFESSTSYTFYPLKNLDTCDIIYDYNPNMKFIYLVRNPIDRIISGYLHHFQRGFITTNINKAIIDDRVFIDISRYYTQIFPYINRFGRNNVLIIDFDDIISCNNHVLQQISEFLNINKFSFPENNNYIKNRTKGGIKIHHKFDNPNILYKTIKKIYPKLWNYILKQSAIKIKNRPVLSAESKKMILHMLDIEINMLQDLMCKSLQHWKKTDTFKSHV